MLSKMLKLIWKNFFTYSLFSTFLCTVILGSGGKIAGTVISQETGDPLPGVNVLIEGTELGAATDTNGDYVILNISSGSYTLQASYIGYAIYRVKNLRVSLDQTTRQNFSLSQEVIAGQEVVVVAKRPMIQKDLTASQRVTTAEEIKEMPVETFLDVLTTQAGVNVGADGALHIRGGRSNEIGYYIDGISVSNPFFTNSLAINVSNKALEEMKIVSGAFNAEYGNAMSGIVNLQIKEGGTKFHGSLSAYSGDYISDDSDIFMNIDDVSLTARKVYEGTLNGPVPFISRGNRLTFNLSGRYSASEGYLYGKREHTPGDSANFDDADNWYIEFGGDNSFVPMNPSKGLNLLGKLTFRITPRLKISAQLLQDRDNYQTYSSSAYNNTHAYKYNPDGTSEYESKNYNYSLKINHSLSSKSFYEGHIFYSTTDFKKYQFEPIDLTSAVSMDEYTGSEEGMTLVYLDINEDTDNNRYYILWNSKYIPETRIQGSPTSSTFVFGGTQRENIYRQSVSLGAKIDLTNQITSKHEIKTGISVREDNLEERIFEILYDNQVYRIPTIVPENSSPTHSFYNKKAIFGSAYLQDKIEYQNFIMNLGIRYDYFNPNSNYITNLIEPEGERKKADPKVMISPRLGVAFPITDRGVLHFSYGHFYQMPILRNLFKEPIFGVGEAPSVGYADLNPEKTVLYEFGLQQQLTNVMAIEVSVFYKDIRELLALQSIVYKGEQGPASYSIYLNKDYGSVQGLTFSLSKRYDPITRISAFLDYSYQVTDGNSVPPGSFYFNAITGIEEEKKIVPLNWDQQHIINATVTISDPNNWGMSFITKLSKGWPYTPSYLKSSALQNINPDPNSSRKPWQKSVDVRIYKNINIGRLQYVVFAKIYNLFDIRNERYVFNDTGRAGYTFINQTSQETEEFKSHYGEAGIHTWSEYQVRPHYYRAPRLITLGFSIDF